SAEAESCFNILISPRKDKEGLPTGKHRVLPTFSIRLNSKDDILIKNILKYFQVVEKYQEEGKFVVYCVGSVDHSNKKTVPAPEPYIPVASRMAFHVPYGTPEHKGYLASSGWLTVF
ncbi:3980_t:CDS:2, partial [Funneliformis geosporum]